MSSKLRKPPKDPGRAARFRNEGSAILKADRAALALGTPYDLGGAIARALERAYREAFAAAQSLEPMAPPNDPSGVVDPALMGRKAREAFEWFGAFASRDGSAIPLDARLEPQLTERGTPGWRVVTHRSDSGYVIGGASVRPLVRFGLFEPDPDHEGRLRFTSRGRVTWARHFRPKTGGAEE